MKKTMWIASAIVLLAATTSVAAGARPDKPYKNWFGHLGVGYAYTQGDASDVLDDDWFFYGGATYWPTDWPIGISLDLGYVDFGVSKATIDRINEILQQEPQNQGRIDGGQVEIWQLTANGVWGPGKGGGTGIYLTAGIGAYYIEGRLKENGLMYYPPFCEPFWPWRCFPGGFGQGSITRARETSTEFGWNAGIGFALEVGASGSQVIFEARYHSVSLDVEDLTYVPVTVGYRW